jgi:hypothetical protein
LLLDHPICIGYGLLNEIDLFRILSWQDLHHFQKTSEALMKQAIKDFLCDEHVRTLIGDPHELVLFFQTACMAAGIDPYIDDTDELVATLDEQLKTRFSPDLEIEAIDADTGYPATKRSEVVSLLISPVKPITIH